MADSEGLDLTEGAIISRLTKMALPILGTSFLQMIYNLTDMFWLGRLSAASLAGAGIGGYILWILASIAALCRSGSEILVSHSKGKKDLSGVEAIAKTALFWVFVIACITSVTLISNAYRIVSAFGLEDSYAAAEGVRYIRVVGFGALFPLVVHALTGLSIGLGNSRTPFFISLLTVGINIVLDPVLIFTFNMKAAGAAYATIFANAVGAILLFWKYRQYFSKFFNFRAYFFTSRQFLLLGFPQSIESFSYAFISLIVGTFIGRFGAPVLAANSLGAQVESLTWMIAIGLAAASTAFTGQNYGAKRYERIRKGYFAVLGICFAYSSVIALMFFAAPGFVSRIFSNQPDVIDKSIEYFRILAISQPFMALEIAIAGTFRGIQKPTLPAVLSIVTTVVRVPLAWIAYSSGFSYLAIWWIISGTSIVKGLAITLPFYPVFQKSIKKAEKN